MPGYIFQYSVFIFVFFLSLLTNTAKEFLSTFMKSIAVIVLFIFVVQVFIIRNEDSQQLWSFIYFSNTGLQESLNLTSKIVAISSVIIYFFQITEIKDINYALEKSRTPKKVTFVIRSTIGLIPQISDLSNT